MKVLVVGANGKIGKQVVQQLQASPQHEALAMIRKAEQESFFQSLGAETTLVDLEGPVDAIADAADGVGAVVFTAGSGGHTGADKTLLIDLDGAIKTIEAAKQAGVKRFIIVSAIGVHNRATWSDKIAHYSAAKHYADEWLMKSGLDYTIIRPGGLTDEQGIGKVKAAKDLERGMIAREDVAATILASLNEPTTIGKDFDLVGGETPIADALKELK
ncbi:SDR family oxidoreductase [Aureibacillus halotolerans]|uniref:Uncharacterized protein YbjT (DUF2867 family) n=1 Tax=Aureibacillus halotolerans TaxID=1508390 RepID=A0A4R6TZM0_9BACI|nr:SDR family oxidoreductase [Aureibacillus halotolerans]TDQ36244.1 uncharacterized protein YbjT (DUF2867 family) [Aureibacillus halotolerans]